MGRNIFVPLPPATCDALLRLADNEWRHPKYQAALLITEALEHRGLMPASQPDPHPEAPDAPVASSQDRIPQ
jgi:hypothetical protein